MVHTTHIFSAEPIGLTPLRSTPKFVTGLVRRDALSFLKGIPTRRIFAKGRDDMLTTTLAFIAGRLLSTGSRESVQGGRGKSGEGRDQHPETFHGVLLSDKQPHGEGFEEFGHR